jgi:hypothetical protein
MMLASMAERKQPRMPLACKGNDYFRNNQEKGGNLSDVRKITQKFGGLIFSVYFCTQSTLARETVKN